MAIINDIFPKINDVIPDVDYGKYEIWTGPEIQDKTLESIIENLKNKKAPGFDGISNSVVKAIYYQKNPQLFVLMYNKCLHYKYFPSYSKMRKIKLLNKAVYLARTYNYRPITLLPVLGEIFKKIIKQLLEAEMIHLS